MLKNNIDSIQEMDQKLTELFRTPGYIYVYWHSDNLPPAEYWLMIFVCICGKCLLPSKESCVLESLSDMNNALILTVLYYQH